MVRLPVQPAAHLVPDPPQRVSSDRPVAVGVAAQPAWPEQASAFPRHSSADTPPLCGLLSLRRDERQCRLERPLASDCDWSSSAPRTSSTLSAQIAGKSSNITRRANKHTRPDALLDECINKVRANKASSSGHKDTGACLHQRGTWCYPSGTHSSSNHVRSDAR